jgi:hypothetical protein
MKRFLSLPTEARDHSPLQSEATVGAILRAVEQERREVEKCFGINLQFGWDSR